MTIATQIAEDFNSDFAGGLEKLIGEQFEAVAWHVGRGDFVIGAQKILDAHLREAGGEAQFHALDGRAAGFLQENRFREGFPFL